MTEERCPRCDLPRVSAATWRAYIDDHIDEPAGDVIDAFYAEHADECVAFDDAGCRRPAHDWRARALAAESERDALRADLKAWADELEKSRAGQFIAAEVRRRFLDAPDVGRGGAK